MKNKFTFFITVHYLFVIKQRNSIKYLMYHIKNDTDTQIGITGYTIIGTYYFRVKDVIVNVETKSSSHGSL